MSSPSSIGEKMRTIIIILSILFLTNCSKKAHITWDTKLFSDEKLEQEIGEIKKGTIVDALDYRHHGWSVRGSIKIQHEGKVGYISPRAAVIDQDPNNSVYTWGHRKDYKYFYDPNDKEHFPKGFEHPAVKNLSKEKIPLEKIMENVTIQE
ncbi:MAG: hypothetical protein EBS19_00425 [Spirochaetia bacterium]|nr:hypothetical protein [Spirochaetia bacterium]